MYTLKGTVWNPFCLVYSSINCFSNEIVRDKEPIHISGKITTVPGLFSEHQLQDKNKRQIMNVHTKKNCLILIMFSPYDQSTLSLIQASSIFNTFYWLYFDIRGDVVLLFKVPVQTCLDPVCRLLLDISRIWQLNLLCNITFSD